MNTACDPPDWWIGTANREDLTWPVAALRENAQEVGLRRKAKGTLAPTARARTVADHPHKLVAAVLERLPLGKGFEADAGWFLLLGLAAGESGMALDARVGQMLTDRGWRTQGSSQVSSHVSASDAHPRRRANTRHAGVNGRAAPSRRPRPRHPISPSHPARHHHHRVNTPVVSARPCW